MATSKQGLARGEVQEMIDAAVTRSIREVTWLMAVVVPELVKSGQWTPEERAKFAVVLDGVAESQKADGRLGASTAAAALSEALQAQARRGN